MREVRAKTLVVWDEQERRQRTIPRSVFERALRQRALEYVGVARKRTA